MSKPTTHDLQVAHCIVEYVPSPEELAADQTNLPSKTEEALEIEAQATRFLQRYRQIAKAVREKLIGESLPMIPDILNTRKFRDE